MLRKVSTALALLLAFSFGASLMGDESVQTYFPSTLGSYWVYEDQDGNELTRTAIEGEEIAGETYHAFSYEPALEDWINYNPFIAPSLYQISDTGITFLVGDEVEKALKTRLTNEINIYNESAKNLLPPGVEIDITFDVEGEGQEHLYLLPDSIVANEEWDANQIEAKIKMKISGENISGPEEITLNFSIFETGIVQGTEAVETSAGTFEACLKVEYRTEITTVINPEPPPDALSTPGETVTTLWFAPNVGIVKLHQEAHPLFLGIIPEAEELGISREPKIKTFELKKYEIKSDAPEAE